MKKTTVLFIIGLLLLLPMVMATTIGTTVLNRLVFGNDNATMEYDAATSKLDVTGNVNFEGTVNCESTLAVAGALTSLSATEAVSGDDALLASQSGSCLAYLGKKVGGASTCTLPSAAAGLWFIIVDANATAASDLSVDPATGDSINGDTAGHKITCVTDADGEAVLIFATDETNWYTATISAAAAWTEE